ncbi:bifunctional hydroxymethylpyrimidine kinase/phosphomethylpyrimidine kinase [Candidatus Kirkpatrickella diaphorinae]|uniref:hydroxymethylpyrimidine kinase n=1 Tax=Candidatus Kirkpatrickella diaphorinae TaxID=2984322 RepID=A0ABY6GJ07_9PROT|nr:bifunctional hydroxymethylpyrimidine kinase/phosphomethylpyrimidine kinase [Candidatus Kirkpatrickella diaphorinae]UYH50843.1 bifunctional hydroxymethylpyrimidine kinase/phosphomethylpyrimidine kinase [Candidatus Kirkpatrickella diaphorinae]
MISRTPISNLLTIAGTDPTGGAGIQADLKTFSALGAYGMSVITAVVAQNTRGVSAVTPMTPDCVAAQIDAVFDDVRVDAVKIGMLHEEGIIKSVASRLRHYRPDIIVLDPVMMAKSGDPLLDPNAISALKTYLLPLATLVTPNLPEAAALLGASVAQFDDEVRAQLHDFSKLGARATLLKGGHSHNVTESTDWLHDMSRAEDEPIAFTSPRIDTHCDHGTGCTLSAAIAALLPQHDLISSIRRAKTYLDGALAAAQALSVGQGHGPLHHFHAMWPTHPAAR